MSLLRSYKIMKAFKLLSLCFLLLISLTLISVFPKLAIAEHRYNDKTTSNIVWTKHSIVSGYDFDTIKLADFNRDSFLDIVSPVEAEGGFILAINPGSNHVEQKWEFVQIGTTKGCEEATPMDVDLDGFLDVVLACSGSLESQRQLEVYWSPTNAMDVISATAWVSSTIPVSEGFRWRTTSPITFNSERFLVGGTWRQGIHLIEIADDPHDTTLWKRQLLKESGIIMSLIVSDMNGDGLDDVIYTDRTGWFHINAGLGWIENSGGGELWQDHVIDNSQVPPDGSGGTYMKAYEADMNGDGKLDIVTAVLTGHILISYRLDDVGDSWETEEITIVGDIADPKTVAVGDIVGGDSYEIAMTSEHAYTTTLGVYILEHVADDIWQAIDVGGEPGIKFSNVVLLDLDQDGDVDLLTSEESQLDQIIYYENPKIQKLYLPILFKNSSQIDFRDDVFVVLEE